MPGGKFHQQVSRAPELPPKLPQSLSGKYAVRVIVLHHLTLLSPEAANCPAVHKSAQISEQLLHTS